MEIKHNFNIMNPQGNKQNQHVPSNSRVPDPRLNPSYLYQHPSQMGDFRNYMMPINQYYFPQFPYTNLSCPSSAYYAPIPPQWRELHFSHPGFMKEMSSLSNFYNMQTARVAMRETRDRSQQEVINLQSDEEQKKTKFNALVPQNNVTLKQNQKPIQVIQLDENSVDRQRRIPEIPIINPATTNAQYVAKVEKPEAKLQKFENYEARKKQIRDQLKTKIILKHKKKQHKLHKEHRQHKQHKQHKSHNKQHKDHKQHKQHKDHKLLQRLQKQDKSSKQRKKKYIDNQKKKIKEDREVVDKVFQKIEKKKTEKNQKSIPTQNKKKVEQGHTRQIAKYMQSHGQIRHGKQFQSDIPSIGISTGTQFNSWLQTKRNKLLKREVGPLTY